VSEIAQTESINPKTTELDLVSIEAMLGLINHEDQSVALAVKKSIPKLATVVTLIVERFRQGGRLIYVGAGTSGRLGVLDASECPPTFSVSPELVIGIIAGGERALRHALEGAEDDAEAGGAALEFVRKTDVVIGLSASGSAQFVCGALKKARAKEAITVSLTCSPGSPMEELAHHALVVETGPEVLTGSTRMKAGTAQKLVLNMISTAVMVAWGKTYRNLMVDVKPSNAKLRARALRLVSHIAQCSEAQAKIELEACEWNVKPAIVCKVLGLNYQSAQERLKEHHGVLRRLLEAVTGH
jgi:N-acetylmuramic acid 6-phosphate etherase